MISKYMWLMLKRNVCRKRTSNNIWVILPFHTVYHTAANPWEHMNPLLLLSTDNTFWSSQTWEVRGSQVIKIRDCEGLAVLCYCGFVIINRKNSRTLNKTFALKMITPQCWFNVTCLYMTRCWMWFRRIWIDYYATKAIQSVSVTVVFHSY